MTLHRPDEGAPLFRTKQTFGDNIVQVNGTFTSLPDHNLLNELPRSQAIKSGMAISFSKDPAKDSGFQPMKKNSKNSKNSNQNIGVNANPNIGSNANNAQAQSQKYYMSDAYTQNQNNHSNNSKQPISSKQEQYLYSKMQDLQSQMQLVINQMNINPNRYGQETNAMSQQQMQQMQQMQMS